MEYKEVSGKLETSETKVIKVTHDMRILKLQRERLSSELAKIDLLIDEALKLGLSIDAQPIGINEEV